MYKLKKNNVVLFYSALYLCTFATGFVTREVSLIYQTSLLRPAAVSRVGRVSSSLLAEKEKKEISPRNKKLPQKTSSSGKENSGQNNDEEVGTIRATKQRAALLDEAELRNESVIVRILRKYNLDSNIEVVHTKLDLPVIGEVFVNGEWNLCLVKGFKPPSSLATESKASEIKPPRVEVLLIRENYNNEPIDYKKEEVLQEHLHVVDMGQIISIWTQFHLNSFKGFKECANYLSSQLTIASDKIRFGLPVNRAEISMKGLYESRVKVRQGGKNSLTKKKISQICSALPSPEYGNHVGQIIHSVRKAGRLVNYSDAGFSVLGSKKSETDITQSLVGAMILAQDASLGGRFIFLSSSVGSSSRRKEETNTAPTVATPIKTVDSESVANWLLLTVFSRSFSFRSFLTAASRSFALRFLSSSSNANFNFSPSASFSRRIFRSSSSFSS